MKVLVTGSAGFIGYHLVKHLLAIGHEVYGYDALTDYYSRGLKDSRHKELSRIKGFVEVKATELENLDFENLFHMAAQPGVRLSSSNKSLYLKRNVIEFNDVLDLALRKNARLIYASSSSVYGVYTNAATEQQLMKPNSFYGLTKLIGENIAEFYAREYGLKAAGLRFFTVYGENGRPDMAYWIFLSQALRGNKINLFQKQATRDMTYIDDAVRGINCIFSNFEFENHEVFNISSEQVVTMESVIEEYQCILNREIPFSYTSSFEGDLNFTKADCTKIKEYGFQPKSSLKEGLNRFSQWYIRNQDFLQKMGL